MSENPSDPTDEQSAETDDDEPDTLVSESRPEHAQQQPQGQGQGQGQPQQGRAQENTPSQSQSQPQGQSQPSQGDAPPDEGETVSVDFSELPEDVQRDLMEQEGHDEGPSEEFFEELNESNRAKLEQHQRQEAEPQGQQRGQSQGQDAQPQGQQQGQTQPQSYQQQGQSQQADDPAASSTSPQAASDQSAGEEPRRTQEARTEDATDTHATRETPTETQTEPEHQPAADEQPSTQGQPQSQQPEPGTVDQSEVEQRTADSDDEVEDPYETQDFSDLERTAEPREVLIRGVRFLLKDPAEQDDEDATLNEVADDLNEAMTEYQDPTTGQLDPDKLDEEGLDRIMKSTVRAVVAKPSIPDERWDSWERGPKMALLNAVRQYTDEHVSGFTMRPVSGDGRGGPGFRG